MTKHKQPDIFITRNQLIMLRNGPDIGDDWDFDEAHTLPLNYNAMPVDAATKIDYAVITWTLVEKFPHPTSHGIRVFVEA